MAVKSAHRVLEIFELLSKNKSGLSIADISKKLDIPQSSTSNLIKTLYNSGYVARDEAKKYVLGVRLIQLGSVAMESFDISAVAKPILQELVKEVQETAFLAIRAQNEVVYILKIDSNRSVNTTAQPGYHRPLYDTGLGKAFLASMNKREQHEILSNIKLTPVTEHTITDRNVLIRQLEQFKRQGYAVDDEESEYGLYCIATTISTVDKNIEAAISISGLKARIVSNKETIVGHLFDAANEISRKLGGK
ncbi:IclR family transcriptional regulator [Clostridium luticellarii]|jgi:DNA-binding IclR family transcriptional regulator|uniref:HTH-type transcriptional repressor AllR n=1 Tax=Clostridium luticellarii TaxID=1691940 RepID=A0A2T0BQE3_9CLOT|nr:IclR family transcriptional regulator [Clostridium luticellarii]MCI1944436.1 IclR family transcriptional regulator [Clostridium luticellarii]MCI1967935.1 IclR family transcriptional regulator [Clostridium luticellarii]MCI1995126.1 IclR family transcriptional regulator [Clostridium luticellarii]MCI2039285.1 IclR family transcriptional regulator [Clostridium luticellarii]PRR86065.1 HTH-type transcriptional repressor AllR [Clostridium luticellarii]